MNREQIIELINHEHGTLNEYENMLDSLLNHQTVVLEAQYVTNRMRQVIKEEIKAQIETHEKMLRSMLKEDNNA